MKVNEIYCGYTFSHNTRIRPSVACSHSMCARLQQKTVFETAVVTVLCVHCCPSTTTKPHTHTQTKTLSFRSLVVIVNAAVAVVECWLCVDCGLFLFFCKLIFNFIFAKIFKKKSKRRTLRRKKMRKNRAY